MRGGRMLLVLSPAAEEFFYSPHLRRNLNLAEEKASASKENVHEVRFSD